MLPVRLLTPSTLKGENGKLKREMSNNGEECKGQDTTGSTNHLTWTAPQRDPHHCTTAVPTIGIEWPTGVAREAKLSVDSTSIIGCDVHTTTDNTTSSVGHCMSRNVSIVEWCNEQIGRDGWRWGWGGMGKVGREAVLSHRAHTQNPMPQNVRRQRVLVLSGTEQSSLHVTGFMFCSVVGTHLNASKAAKTLFAPP